MEPNSISEICSVCHQPILAGYYFCPNCGNDLNKKPLPTSVWAQVSLYVFSLILPMILFLYVTRWQGVKYLKSSDKKTKNIGIVACVILGLSTVFTIWLAYVWTESAIQASVNSINTDMGAY